MARSDTYDRLNRLDRIAMRLKQDRACTVADLAQEHGVSARTISRDLAVMRDRGLQIDADRGRGGGLRLDPTWGVGRLNLSYAEAVDLLISTTVAEQMGSPLFLGNLAAVRRQLVASFSKSKRDAVARVKSRILIGPSAPVTVQGKAATPPAQVVERLHQAFLDRETLRIRYTREDGAQSDREIDPHYLLLRHPVWYVVAMDHLRAAPRVFRCDRISAASRTGSGFALRPVSDFDAPLVGLAQALRD